MCEHRRLRIAALYDVHGNLPALEAVLAEVEHASVDAIVFGGDIASGPPSPRETIQLVRSLPNAWSIRGNADRVRDFPGDEGAVWLLARLDADQVEWLAQLPFSVELDETLYVHATPKDDESVVTELTSDDRLTQLLEGVTQKRIVAGHTHMQLERRLGEVAFVNAGSVGRPYEGRPGAYWALLDENSCAFRRTDYDYEAAAELVRRSGHPRAGRIATANVLQAPSRAEALRALEC